MQIEKKKRCEISDKLLQDKLTKINSICGTVFSGVSKVTRRCFSFLYSLLNNFFRQYINFAIWCWASHSTVRLQNNLMINELFFGKKRWQTRRLLHGLYSSFNSSDRKYIFSVNLHSFNFGDWRFYRKQNKTKQKKLKYYFSFLIWKVSSLWP